MTPELRQEATHFQQLQQRIAEHHKETTEQRKEVGSSLLPYLFHSDPYWRARAANQLGRLQASAYWAYPALTEQLSREKSERVSLALLNALSMLQTPSEEITECLLDLIQQTSSLLLKRTAIEALGPVATSAAIPLLREALPDEYLAPGALYSLYCLGLEGEEQSEAYEREHRQAPWWSWAVLYAKERLAQLPSLSASTASRISQNAPPSLLRLLAQHPNLGASLLKRLASHQETRIRARVAANHSTPANTLQRLCADPFEGVRCSAATNPSLTPEMIALLSQDPSPFVRVRLAQHPSLPERYLFDLARSGSPYERRAVSSNPSLPLDELVRLASDPETLVRGAVAGHKRLPEEVLWRLLDDPCEELQYRLIYRDALSPALFERLSTDDSLHIGLTISASASIEFIEQRIQDEASNARAIIPFAEVGAGWILRALAKDPSAEVRLSTAQTSNTTDDILELLSRDPSDEVRRVVAKSASTSLAERMIEDPFNAVRSDLGANPGLTPRLIEELLARGTDDTYLAKHPNLPMQRLLSLQSGHRFENPKLPVERFPEQSTGLPWQARRALAANPRTPIALLIQLSEDPDELTRSFVAANESTPLERLRLMSSDPSQRVLWRLVYQETLPPSERAQIAQRIPDNSPLDAMYW